MSGAGASVGEVMSGTGGAGASDVGEEEMMSDTGGNISEGEVGTSDIGEGEVTVGDGSKMDAGEIAFEGEEDSSSEEGYSEGEEEEDGEMTGEGEYFTSSVRSSAANIGGVRESVPSPAGILHHQCVRGSGGSIILLLELRPSFKCTN